jgi:DNA-binding transcriptional MerR regulator
MGAFYPTSPSFNGTILDGGGYAGSVAGMTIDELARRAGTTSRNVRAYQERGLLPPPERAGRVGVYGEGHLARLLLIARLLERGFSLAAIGELLRAWETGHSVRDVLGLEEAAFAGDIPAPVTMSADDLGARFGGVDGDAVRRAIQLGLLEQTDEGFRVLAPQLLEVGAELVALGIPVGAVVEEAAQLLVDTDRIASRFVGLFMTHVAEPYVGGGATDDELREAAEKVRAARPLAARALDRALAIAMARHLADALSAVMGEGGTDSSAAS